MDREKAITSVVASAITAVVLYVGAIAFDFFSVSLDPTDVPKVAREFVNDADTRDTLLNFMARDDDQRFRGPPGADGIEGPRGPQGPLGQVPDAAVKRFTLDSPKETPTSKSETLGAHQFCALSRVHLPHATQACGCIITQRGTVWSLDLVTDTRASGGCRCSAMCVDW